MNGQVGLHGPYEPALKRVAAGFAILHVLRMEMKQVAVPELLNPLTDIEAAEGTPAHGAGDQDGYREEVSEVDRGLRRRVCRALLDLLEPAQRPAIEVLGRDGDVRLHLLCPGPPLQTSYEATQPLPVTVRSEGPDDQVHRQDPSRLRRGRERPFPS